ncbi:G-protein coupled receptor 4-like [Salarias fasciatus]|uniref:G-protein coupled receptor 4-like n=1 Tax=Salarias fasciatus TaxID=181472 RepID=A0A672IBI6_SALFA|nr:G-protein coupled receptor 4-like [Salarias fasciatus]XP_029964529.1 G-protein coupled receptor 4-like [Salarias fasciatus]XP_029964530.1 G-protein coupled receptor 4-like [Salarias fasciatus]XP_029964531.1 G-protein coupled receptor 4-like [Salarias fasciatus]
MNVTVTMAVKDMNTSTSMCVTIESLGFSTFLMSVYIVAFIFGLLFNGLTLGPIYQQVQRQNVLGIFLLSLSISDMLFIFTMPLWMNYYRKGHQWGLGVGSCSVAGFFYYSNMYISIFLLCCISVDRCLVVTYPLRFKAQRTSRYAWAQCITVYVVVVVMHIMVLIYDNLKDAHDDKNDNDRCYETYPMQSNVAMFNLIRVCVGFLLPLLVLTVSYWRVLATVGESPGLNAQAKRKIRLLSFGVIGIFFFCFAPYHILLLTRSIVFYRYRDDTTPQGPYCQFEQSMHMYFSSTLALSSLNCVVDPVLYVLVSNLVQDKLKQCWKGRRQTRQRTVAEGENCVLTRTTKITSNNNLI